MFELWAEAALAGFRQVTGHAGVDQRHSVLWGRLSFILDAYREHGAQNALDWCEWWMREAATVSERMLAKSVAEQISDELGCE